MTQMTQTPQKQYKAKCEFHTENRSYNIGDEVDPTDINRMILEMCLVSTGDAITKYTVTLSANGGIGNDIRSQTESLFTLPACTFEPPVDKEFKGWSADPNGLSVKSVGEHLSVIQDTTYYAIWQTPKIAIKFDANGGTGTMAEVRVDKSIEYLLPACTFTAPKDKTFKGWSLDKTSVVTKVTPIADTTVYALWQDKLVQQPPVEAAKK